MDEINANCLAVAGVMDFQGVGGLLLFYMPERYYS
jgi:hypothetical protein